MRVVRAFVHRSSGAGTVASSVSWWLLLLVPAALSAQTRGEHATLVEGTGSYSRPISTKSEAAQRFFDQGLRLNWAYYFPEAMASFREAARFDPSDPMIHLGMALAAGPNPNSRRVDRPDDPAGEGLTAIRRALALIDHSTPAVERALIEALHVRYDAAAYPQREERDRAYYERTRVLLGEYPDDPDIAALYADAFMTLSPWEYWDDQGRPLPGTEDVSRVLERSMSLVPSHPGTHHLYIHLHEASLRPERALAVADRLEALMPNAGHIVHMPSHIYLRVGRYAQAVAQNRRSIEADERFKEAWGNHELPFVTSLPMSHAFHAWHAYDFMLYAAVQLGNYAQSVEVAEAALRMAQNFSGSGVCAADRNTIALWFVERTFGKWESLLKRLEERPDEQCVLLRGMRHYMRGSAFNGMGLRTQAEREADALHDMNTTKTSLDLLMIAAAALEGELSESAGDLEHAIEAFRNATTLEDALPYTEPPEWPIPMRRFLGNALLAAGRAAEAEEVYLSDLGWNQNNGWALHGLWQSLRLQGKTADAEAARERFEAAWSNADVALDVRRY